jgi:O-antigen/teichoic acid export membrane protein
MTTGVRQLAVLLVTTVQTLVVAQVLGPSGFGTYAIVIILSMMAAVCTPGFLAVAAREVPHFSALGDMDAVRRVTNHAFCGELAVAALWSVVAAVVAVAQGSKDILIYLGWVAASILPNRLLACYQLLAYRDKAFEFQSRCTLVVSLVTAALAIGLVSLIGVSAPLLAPVAGAIGGIIVARSRYRLDLRWRDLSAPELRRLARVGLPMAGLGVFSANNGLQRWGERWLLNVYLGAPQVGIYAFFGWITMAIYSLFGSVLQTVQPHVHELAARNIQQNIASILRASAIVTIAAAVTIGAAAAALPGLIDSLLPAYSGHRDILRLQLAATFVSCIYWVPAILMGTVRVNAQSRYLLFWALAVVASLFCSYLLLAAGFGLVSAAWGYLLSQLILAVATFDYLRRDLQLGRDDMLAYVRDMAWPLLNVFSALALLTWAESAVANHSSNIGDLVSALASGIAYLVLCAPSIILLERRTGFLRRPTGPQSD